MFTSPIFDPLLGMSADVVDDLEMVRVANENRLRTMLSDDPEYGDNLTLEHPDVARLAAIVKALSDAEKAAIKQLELSMRRHPLGPWVKATVGIGEKQAGRLLALIRDPYWNELHDRPRTVGELWAYCGLHVVDGSAPARKRGVQANWNDDARKRVWLIAASCIKQAGSPYRITYDNTRAKYADAEHGTECKRCGPKGKPALPGSALSDGHKHARAMRVMMKEILRDMWLRAKSIHEASEVAIAA